MNATRRRIIGAATAALIAKPLRAQSGGSTKAIRIGVLTDLSGTYKDICGPTGIACVRQAVQEFTAGRDMNVEVLTADFQEKPDVGANIARQWFDRDDVDAIVDLTNSAVALAVSNVAREKNKVALVSGAAVSAVTGKQCSPNTVHWTYDTWMLAHSTGTKTLEAGGKTWFLIAPDYAFGHSLAGDTARAVIEGGGKVLGSVMYPFPDTTDYSGLLVQAQGSEAQVLGLCNGGTDLVNSLKQAHEFRLQRKMRVAGLLIFTQIVRAVGLPIAQGLYLTETFYWDLNERTRAFTDRIRPKTFDNWPSMIQAGDYAATLHYLKAVADMGVAAAKDDGGAVVARMKTIPTDDDCFGPGTIREDGRALHPAYLFKVKSPAESRHDWDLYKLVATTPAEQAFRPLSEGGCPLVHT
jgi:branched-chain amino acid transport system substrate-binding protein